MNRFLLRRVISALCAGSIVGCPVVSFASGYQLWEQDGASVGNYHAGYAAEANDASIAFYNPAGIPRIKNQQVVFSADAVTTDFKYEGTIGVNTILAGAPRSVTAQGGNFNLIPALHYVAPIDDCIGFGFSVDVPFGLKTTYGRETILRYAATTTAANVINISPSLGFQVTKKFSFGIGLDVQRMYAEFDQVGGLGLPTVDAEGINKKANDTRYGFHTGIMYQFSHDTRAGLSYHSQVVHHLTGTSSFVGPLATAFNGGPFSSQGYANLRIPAYTALSLYKHMNRFSMMGTIILTQWNVNRQLYMYNVSGISALSPSRNITVVIPEYYRNTLNVSVGGDYEATDKIKLRAGVGYDQSPVPNAYRNVTLPDNNRVAVAVGGHYQTNKAIGFDIGWTHLFIPQSSINPPPQQTGDQIVTTNGNVTGGADVIAGQVTWNIV